jgi:hypothetical protein
VLWWDFDHIIIEWYYLFVKHNLERYRRVFVCVLVYVCVCVCVRLCRYVCVYGWLGRYNQTFVSFACVDVPVPVGGCTTHTAFRLVPFRKRISARDKELLEVVLNSLIWIPLSVDTRRYIDVRNWTYGLSKGSALR